VEWRWSMSLAELASSDSVDGIVWDRINGIGTTEPNEFSRAFCGRLSGSSYRRFSIHGTRSLGGLLTGRGPAGSPATGLLMGCRARLGVST
jgi:hypothetical protein